MTLLAIETSGHVAGAAVCVDGRIAAEEFTNTRLTHSETIMPMAERVLQAAECECGELDAVAVDIGPGSFTGIRIGVSAANAIAFAIGKPVVGVDSLRCLCANAAGWRGGILTAVDSGNGRVYAAKFTGGNEPERAGDVYFGEFGDWLQTVEREEPWLFLGSAKSGGRAWEEQIVAHSRAITVAGPGLCAHRASSLAVLAYAQLLRGWTAREALPFYVAKPQAERNRQHG